MKLKTPFVLGLSLCMLTGIAFSAVACDNQGDVPPSPPHTDHIDNNHDGKCDECGEAMENPGTDPSDTTDQGYSVTVEIENAALLQNISVLFFSKEGTSEVKELNGKTTVSAQLPDGNYTAYLVGNLEGYTMTPVNLTASSKSGTIKTEPVVPIETNGYDDHGLPAVLKKIYYQILMLLPDGKTVFFGAHPEPDSNYIQICTYDSEYGSCYSAFFDEKTGLAYQNGIDGSWALFDQQKHQAHFPNQEEWPEGCKFDDEKYILSEKGGFYTVMFDKA